MRASLGASNQKCDMKRKQTFLAFVCLCLLSLCPATMGAQGNKVTLKCSDTPLPTALSQVERLSSYYKINYNYSDLSQYKVTADIKDATAPDAVQHLLRGLPFTSTVTEKFIQINKTKTGDGEARGGRITVRGRLLNAEGEPLIGATVKVVGSQTATVTDADGNYTLSGVKTSDVLEYSYIGMKTYRRKASSKPVSIILESDATVLGDVVVTGMQKVDRRLFTGASTQISAEEAKLNGVADISRSLEGRSAGVSVQNVSGTFGTAPKSRCGWSTASSWKT